MKEKRLSLSITNPCSENWNNFTPTSTGGFCASCQKNVVDFTNKTDEEILHFLLNKPANTCGRFRENQLKEYSQIVHTQRTNKLKWVPASVLGLSLLLLNKPALLAQEKAPKSKTEQVNKRQDPQPVKARFPEGFIVKGTVIDKELNEPIPGANVVLKGTSSATVTDMDGKFTFPAKLKDGDVLVISFIGYDFVEYKINQNRSDVVELPPIVISCDYAIMGEVSIDEVYSAKHSGIKNFWSKVKSIF